MMGGFTEDSIGLKLLFQIYYTSVFFLINSMPMPPNMYAESKVLSQGRRVPGLYVGVLEQNGKVCKYYLHCIYILL